LLICPRFGGCWVSRMWGAFLAVGAIISLIGVGILGWAAYQALRPAGSLCPPANPHCGYKPPL